MRAATTMRTGPVPRAKRRPPGRLDSHRKWTERRGQVTTYLHGDARGETRVLTDQNAAVVGSYDYTPYGTASSHTGNSTPLQFGQGYADPTGLIYLRARYYDPTTAQFLTRDPIEQLTQQPYQYANGDPLDQVDPLGLCGHWYDVACKVGSAATAVGGAIVDNAGTLSTVASGLATVAYAGCIVTDGVGCGVGALLSGASTALSGIAAEQACFGGAGGCASAATSFALSAVATASGGLANAAAKGALANAENAYARDVLLYRQYAKIGFLSNGVQTLFGIGTSTLGCF